MASEITMLSTMADDKIVFVLLDETNNLLGALDQKISLFKSNTNLQVVKQNCLCTLSTKFKYAQQQAKHLGLEEHASNKVIDYFKKIQTSSKFAKPQCNICHGTGIITRVFNDRAKFDNYRFIGSHTDSITSNFPAELLTGIKLNTPAWLNANTPDLDYTIMPDALVTDDHWINLHHVEPIDGPRTIIKRDMPKVTAMARNAVERDRVIVPIAVDRQFVNTAERVFVGDCCLASDNE